MFIAENNGGNICEANNTSQISTALMNETSVCFIDKMMMVIG